MTTTVAKDFQSHRGPQKELVSSVSMLVTLISFSMLFATLFLGFALYRVSNDVWPPMGMEKVNLLIPSISTLIIFLSSLSYWLFEKNQDSQKAKGYLFLTFLLGFGFLISQIYLWKGLNAKGLYVGSGIYPSILHAFTWVHAAHLLLGLFSLIFVGVKFLNTSKSYVRSTIKNVGMFWHFLGLIWLIIYLIIFAI